MENLENGIDQSNKDANEKYNENNYNEHRDNQNEKTNENKQPTPIENSDDENKGLNVSNPIDTKKLVKIKTYDNKIYEVPGDIIIKSKLLDGLIEDYDYFNDKDAEIIALSEVDSKNLELVIEYLQHYKDKEPKEIPKPFPERTDEEFLRGILDNDDNDWTYNFISKLSIEEAINLVNAADYLQIKGLIDLLAAKLAHEMCNCEVEEARQKFGIECDMTEEEIAEYDKYPLDEDN